MNTKTIFVFILSFALAWTENVSEDQVLETEKPENTQISESTQNFESTVSNSVKDKIEQKQLLN